MPKILIIIDKQTTSNSERRDPITHTFGFVVCCVSELCSPLTFITPSQSDRRYWQFTFVFFMCVCLSSAYTRKLNPGLFGNSITNPNLNIQNEHQILDWLCGWEDRDLGSEIDCQGSNLVLVEFFFSSFVIFLKHNSTNLLQQTILCHWFHVLFRMLFQSLQW